MTFLEFPYITSKISTKWFYKINNITFRRSVAKFILLLCYETTNPEIKANKQTTHFQILFSKIQGTTTVERSSQEAYQSKYIF